MALCPTTGETLHDVESASARDLHDHGGEVLDRVARGQALVATRDGQEIAELRPLACQSPSPAVLRAGRRILPGVEVASLRRDLDAGL